MKMTLKTKEMQEALKLSGLNLFKDKYNNNPIISDNILMRTFPDTGIEFVTHGSFRIGSSESHYSTLSVFLNNPNDITIEEQGNSLVNFQKLQAIIDTISSNKISYSDDGNHFEVNSTLINQKKGGKGCSSNVDEYPFPVFLTNRSSYHKVDAVQFKKDLEQVSYAIAKKDEVRSVLQTVCCELSHTGYSSTYKLITADGRRLAMKTGNLIKSPFNKYEDIEKKEGEPAPELKTMATINIPGTIVALLGKLLSHCKSGSTLTIRSEKDTADFIFRNNILEFQLKTTTNQGRFPNYSQVIPSHSDYTILMEKKDVVKLMKTHVNYCNKVHKINNLDNKDDVTMSNLKIDGPSDNLHISSGLYEDIVFDEVVYTTPSHVDSRDIKMDVYFKPIFFSEAVENCESDIVCIKFCYNAVNPIVVESENGDYIGIIMPIRLKNGGNGTKEVNG